MGILMLRRLKQTGTKTIAGAKIDDIVVGLLSKLETPDIFKDHLTRILKDKV